MYRQKKKFSTFSYKLVQISPIMTLVKSGAFLSISSWFCDFTELIFVMIPYISSTSYPPKTQGIMGHVQVANKQNGEGKEITNFLGLQSFMQSHSNENGKDVMICNDLT